MSCRFGDVLVWAKKASLKVGSVALPAIVVHHDVGTLAEAGERLVRRSRRIDPHLDRIRVGQQVGVEKLGIFRIDLAVFLFELGVFGAVGFGGILLAQGLTRAHGGAHPVERCEAAVGIPGLVPEENDVRLDRQHLLHETLHVVDVAVEGAVGEQQHPHPVELTFSL